ncbi:MAG: nitroreductase family protein [Candidatus Krumholzibacteriota bacterium]|nr:nitroreductase family protein [Candidatus Krumholzibacteriota bacterium]
MSNENIFARRSIRKYSNLPVGREDITALLEAGMAAPSGRNLKPWHFITVTDREVLDSLAEAHPHGKMLFEATAAIAVCAETAISPDYWVQDCAAATENILVAATGLGLGSVWLGCHPREERVSAIKKVLDIPDGTGILSLIAIGHPAEEKQPRTQYDEERVHRGKW